MAATTSTTLDRNGVVGFDGPTDAFAMRVDSDERLEVIVQQWRDGARWTVTGLAT